MGVFIVLWAAALLTIASLVAIGYFFWYRRAGNRRLVEGGPRREPLMSPARLTVWALIAALVVFAGVVAFMAHSRQTALEPRYLDAVYDFAVYTPQEMSQGYLSGYSADENPGYQKRQEERGGIQFTYFTYTGPFDYYHPAFLIYVEPGEQEKTMMGFSGAFLTQDGQSITSRGASGGPAQPMWIIGTSSVDCIFSFTYYLYGEDQPDPLTASGEMGPAQAWGSVQFELLHDETTVESGWFIDR